MPALSAANTFIPATLIQAGDEFDFSITGTFVGTVTAQISKDQSNWIDVDSLTIPGVLVGSLGSAWYVRAGFKTGAYTSGTANVEVQR